MNTTLGLILAMCAGAMCGSFSLPMKKTRKWAWENTWLIWAVVGLLVVPWAIAFVTVPHLMQVYTRVGYGPLIMTFLFGLGYGIGSMLGGLSIYILGMSLAFAVSLGLSTVLGSLIPMAKDPSVFATAKGMVLTIGIALSALGVVICSIAGGRKEAQARKLAQAESKAVPASRFARGLIICILSGFFGAMLNFAQAYREPIVKAATGLGATAAGASDAVWAVTMLGAFTANVVYCVALLFKNKTGSRYRTKGTGSYWILAVIMGLLWMFSMTVYGKAVSMMGDLGTSVGYAVLMSSIIIASNIWGIITGEWKDGKGRPLNTMYSGLGVLILSICTTAYASRLH